MSKRERIEYPENFVDSGLPKGVFSHSQYGTYKRCGAQYDYRYIQGIIRPPGFSMLRGTCIHESAEYAFKQKMEGIDSTLEELRALASDRYDEEIDSVEEEVESNAKDGVIALVDVLHAKVIPTINPIKVEHGVATVLGDVPLIGYIDVIDNKQSHRDIVDFKTTKTKWSQGKVDSSTQLTLYSHMTQTPTVRIDQLVIRKTGAAFDSTTSTRGPHDVEVLAEDLNQVVGFIKQGVFPKAEIGSWQCSAKFCGYWDMCRGKKGK